MASLSELLAGYGRVGYCTVSWIWVVDKKAYNPPLTPALASELPDSMGLRFFLEGVPPAPQFNEKVKKK